MQAHTLGPLRKIFYIKPEVYNKLREIAMEKRISIDDCTEELLREHFMLEEFIKGIDLDSDLEYYR
jgi:predicted P-loop ATPase/GTPase